MFAINEQLMAPAGVARLAADAEFSNLCGVILQEARRLSIEGFLARKNARNPQQFDPARAAAFSGAPSLPPGVGFAMALSRSTKADEKASAILKAFNRILPRVLVGHTTLPVALTDKENPLCIALNISRGGWGTARALQTCQDTIGITDRALNPMAILALSWNEESARDESLVRTISFASTAAGESAASTGPG